MDAPVSCHLVQIHASPVDGEPVLCAPTLPGDVLSRIDQTIDRWRRPARWVRALHELRVAAGIPGLAVWFTDEFSLPPVPAPFHDQFEPIPLDENARPFRSLFEGQEVVPSAGIEWLSARRNANRKRRILHLLRVLLFWAALLAYVHFSGWPSVKDVYGLALIVLAALVVIPLTSGLDQWLVIPQGVLVERRLAFFRSRRERLTRHDATLLVVRDGRTWCAYLSNAHRTYEHDLTDRECLALLAAWQSPARAPELREIASCA